MHLATQTKARINLAELREVEELMPAAVLAAAPLEYIEARRWQINFDKPALTEETDFVVRRITAQRKRPAMQINY